jgi:hypothetical protein
MGRRWSRRSDEVHSRLKGSSLAMGSLPVLDRPWLNSDGGFLVLDKLVHDLP